MSAVHLNIRPLGRRRKSASLDNTMQTLLSHKRGTIADYPTLVGAYSDFDLASPARSTVPLLAYWRTVGGRLEDFTTLLKLDLQAPVHLAFEYTVPVQRGKGTASQTDLMILTNQQAIAIEAKYTEPEYETVERWLGIQATGNRQAVLAGWLHLIGRATGIFLKAADVQECTYQLIHRTASACSPAVDTRFVVYHCFDLPAGMVEYYHCQLARLKRLLNNPEDLTFYLIMTGLKKSQQYRQLEDSWQAGKRDLSTRIRQGLLSDTLLGFETPIVTRV
jgi:hypothetical protein